MKRKNPTLRSDLEYLKHKAQDLAKWVLNNHTELKLTQWTEMLKSRMKRHTLQDVNPCQTDFFFKGKQIV